MDIRELLSPQDSPATETPSQGLSPSPHASPNKHPNRPSTQQRKSSGLSMSTTLSPTHQDVQVPSVVTHNNHQHLPSPTAGVTSTSYPQPTYSSSSIQHSPYNQPIESGANPAYLTIHKQSSTPQMDKLAELASMQYHHQQQQQQQQQQQGAGQNSHSQHNTHPRETHQFSLRYALQFHTGQTLGSLLTLRSAHLPHSVSAHSASELVTTESTVVPSKHFVTSALSDTECEHLTELHTHLTTN